MAKVKFYSKREEKEQRFVLEVIEKTREFDKLLDELNSDKPNIYRGVRSAKYMLYNTAQRFFIEKELVKTGTNYEVFVENQIKNARNWQDGFLEKYFSSFGCKIYDIAVLSFLQHHGGATPFMDWTYNIKNALFFGMDGIEHDAKEGLDNYFSIYLIDKKKCGVELIQLSDIIYDALEKLTEIKKELPVANTDMVEKILKEISYSEMIKEFPLLLVSDLEKSKIPLYSNTNFNIINQEGCFIFNSSAEKPIEEMYFKGKEDIQNGDTFELPKIKCFDIHKNLIPYIKERIKIEEDFIYPKAENLAKEALEQAVLEIIKGK